ncbi:uncharacterized protein MELLADRAFT_93414 [Melampsora larici-populina 98AG31]|uniref:Mitochondrial import inner membrane translocase subunit Tim21 n=1 Tax=Melampsora larici-populina (strain 98AG31 / pathotype 3-4-7) TaxID=747676 RepID=F4RAB0_MELLP|nr:uncharacterized protein MELLADRAFT_93414 [Melampsora larici-populina 98AG31]EGG10811.1 hypothetical protein MELLADRAFT_93414 [Melampsora larici-populina 98AG31]
MRPKKLTSFILSSTFELPSTRPIHSHFLHYTHHQPQPFPPTHSSASSPNLTKPFARTLHQTRSTYHKSLTEELKSLTERDFQKNPRIGPFRIPTDENPSSSNSQMKWNQIRWNEKAKRVLRNGKNILVVGFGGSLGILVIYSITSELFAPSSSTNLMISITETLNRSKILSEILQVPYKFHTSVHSNASKRMKNLENLPQCVEIRFMIEGSPTASSTTYEVLDLEWWKSMTKRWIGPLITSEVNHQGISNKPNVKDLVTEKDDHRQKDWLKELVGSLLPKPMTQGLSKTKERSWKEKRLPTLGTFTQGEVTAKIIKEGGGEWKYNALFIDFPNSRICEYRLDVLNEIRKMDIKDQEKEERAGPTRYRFWTRRISV